MISNKSYNSEWIKLLGKKSKAIHSNIVQIGKSL